MKIPIYKPQLPRYEDVEPEIKEMYLSGMLYPDKYTRRLEEQIRNYQQCDNVLAVSSCSLGLMMLLSFIPKGSMVILPAFTFNATLQALEWNQLIPITCDVDEDGQLIPDLVKECIKTYPEVRAVLPVHMWGNACYVNEFQQLGHNEGISIFYDGAHSFGTTVNGKQLSQFGDGVVFSIAATKPVSAGEGGLIVTKMPVVFDWVSDCAAHGLCGSLDTKIKGTNGKIQEFNSILAYHAINNFDQTRKTRRKIMDTYRKGLSGLPIRIWKPQEKVEPSYKDCVLFVEDKKTRDRLDSFLSERGVGTKRYFEPAIPDMGSFEGIDFSSYNARNLAETCLTIPLYPALTEEEICYIISVIGEFYV